MYKTPQELFASFKIPDLTEKGSERAVSKETQSSKPVRLKRIQQNMPADLASPKDKTKHRKIQPNIRMPASRKMTSPEANKSSSIFQTSPTMLALNGAPRPHFPIPCAGGPVPHFDTIIYGAPGSLLSMHSKFQPSCRLSSSCDSQKYPDQGNGGLGSQVGPLTIEAANTLSQNVGTVQSQMAAAHIPLCLVQDANGKLHQLVYTVPAHIYEQYIQAAKRVLYDHEPVSSEWDKDASKAVDTSYLDSKPKTSRQRKKEAFYLSPKYSRRRKQPKSNDKDICESNILEGTSENVSKAKSGSTSVWEQTMLTLPKVQRPLGPTVAMETSINRKASLDCTSSDTPSSKSLVSSEPSTGEGDMQTLRENYVRDFGSGSGFEESAIDIDASFSRENLTSDRSGDSNKKTELLQTQHDRKSTEVDDVSRSSTTSCTDKVCAHTTHELAVASGEAVKKQPHTYDDRSYTNIDAIIKPHYPNSDDPVMRDALASLKPRVDEDENRPLPGARFNSGTYSEQVSSMYSRSYPDSSNYWPVERLSRASVINVLESATISTLSSDVSVCHAANDLDTSVSDLSCLNEHATSVDSYSPAPMSANSCATFDSGISTSGSFESVDALDNLFEESVEHALEADHSNEDRSFRSHFETDISSNENPEMWINPKFLDNLRDNFFGSDGALVFPENGLINNHSLMPVHPQTREPSSGYFGMNELDFLDSLIEGL